MKKRVRLAKTVNRSKKSKDSWIVILFIIIGIIVLAGIIFSIAKSLTGNVITGMPTSSVTSTQAFFKDIGQTLQPLGGLLLGDISTAPELLVVKILFFLILMAVIYTIVGRVPIFEEYQYIPIILATLMSILAIRFMDSSSLIEFIWLPTGVFGIAITTILPFVLYAVFVESFDASYIRKVCWSAYVVIYIGMAMVRWNSLSPENIGSVAGQNIPNSLAWTINLGWIYLGTALLAVLAIVLDRHIRRLIIGGAIESTRVGELAAQRAHINTEMNRLTTDLANATGDADARRIQRRIDTLQRRAKALR
ncbi:MAG: hypothetical protein WC533_04360 [Candidatus Pacearchaeota archaeon]